MTAKANQTFKPVTFGYLRREAKWLHHEREFDVSQSPFAHMPDHTVVPTLGQSMMCSKCGTEGKIWSVPEFHGASAETLKRWRQTPG